MADGLVLRRGHSRAPSADGETDNLLSPFLALRLRVLVSWRFSSLPFRLRCSWGLLDSFLPKRETLQLETALANECRQNLLFGHPALTQVKRMHDRRLEVNDQSVDRQSNAGRSTPTTEQHRQPKGHGDDSQKTAP